MLTPAAAVLPSGSAAAHARGEGSPPAQSSRQREPAITGTPLGAAVLAAEDNRAPTPAELTTILEGTRSGGESLKRVSIRALGRLERRDVVPYLLPFLQSSDSTYRAEAAFAIAQAMRGERLAADTGPQQVDGVLTALLSAAGAEKNPAVVAALARSLARLPYERAGQVERVEGMLVAMLQLSKSLSVTILDAGDAETVMVGAVRALEMLPRIQRTLYTPDERTTELLQGYARRTQSAGWPGVADALRAPSFYALLSARGVGSESLRASLAPGRDAMLRRAAMALLAGAGSPVDGEERADFIRRGLSDADAPVRYEAVRGYARHLARAEGCLPLVQMLSDRSEHAALAAIDALGEACDADEGSLLALVGEARTPPELGAWRRESRALVSLARRSAAHAAVPLASHTRHTRWQVRMYAARAAAVLDDVAVLERLAMDENDNVREVTLAPLKRLKGSDAEPYFLAALRRDDYQLLRTAARALAGVPATRALSDALVDALLRITAQKRDTSRDTRVALLERIRESGGERYVESLRPLLRDFDRKVAETASGVMAAWTGGAFPIDPQPLPKPPLPSAAELQAIDEQQAVLVLESGREIVLRLAGEAAPMTAVRFYRLANANYFDGLTFHRIVPGFVIQGGSPGANEYMGDGPYLRDEITGRTHARGTVGLSTRGRDTGDAQFFINLVPNPRLDFDYTIFATVAPADVESIDDIGEGDRITDVKFRPGSRRR